MSGNTGELSPHFEEDVDPGTPIEMLAGYEREASSGFLDRLRRKIYRRTTTAQVAIFTWKMPTLVFLELWQILFQILQVKHTNKGRDHEGEAG